MPSKNSSRAAFMAVLLPVGLAIVSAGSVQAGTVVEQEVDVTVDQKSAHSKQRWSIGDGKFALLVNTNGEETRYLFNGRTFYACGKLNSQQIAASKSVKDPTVFAAYKDGTCLVVPTNFMVRFFLSPIPSVTSVDRSDGMRLTLSLKGYQLASRAATKAAGRDCAGSQRSYTITKSSSRDKAAATSINETFCQDPSLPWRQMLWSEVTKAVIRQPQGQVMLADLRRDEQGLRGLVLEADSKQTTTDLAGKSHTHRIVVKTASIKAQDLDPRDFNLPADYKLFSDDGLLIAATVGKDKPSDASSSPPAENQNLIDVMSSVIFCALSGPLACLAAP